MTERDPTVGRYVVVTIGEAMRRRGTRIIKCEDACRNDAAVEAISDDICRDGRGEKPGGIDRLAARKSEPRKCDCTGGGNRDPKYCGTDASHEARIVEGTIGGENDRRLTFVQCS